MRWKWRWNIAQFAERRWWQSYLKNKDVQEYLSWKKKYWQKILDLCKPYLTIASTDVILDAGCGPAGMFMLFPDHKTIAFDPLLDRYESDIPHFKKKFYPNTEFVSAGLEDFIAPQQVDKIFCMNAINHVQDIELSFDKLVSFGKHGSYLIITIDAHNHSFFKHVFRLLPGDILHPHQYDLKEYQSLITNRGYNMLASIHVKHEFFFDHYILIAQKTISTN